MKLFSNEKSESDAAVNCGNGFLFFSVLILMVGISRNPDLLTFPSIMAVLIFPGPIALFGFLIRRWGVKHGGEFKPFWK